MPKKRRTQAEKYRRTAKNVHLKNLQNFKLFLLEYHLFLVGESENANKLATQIAMYLEGLERMQDILKDDIISQM